MALYIGTMDTEHYDFVTVASSPELARKQMTEAFARHCKAYSVGKDESPWTEAEPPVDWYGLNITKIEVGQTVRDMETVV